MSGSRGRAKDQEVYPSPLVLATLDPAAIAMRRRPRQAGRRQSIIGRTIGIQNFAANIAGIFAPLVTAWLKQSTGSYEASLQVIWVILLIGIAAYVFLVRQGPASQSID